MRESRRKRLVFTQLVKGMRDADSDSEKDACGDHSAKAILLQQATSSPGCGELATCHKTTPRLSKWHTMFMLI